jgi:hypothetical protein
MRYLRAYVACICGDYLLRVRIRNAGKRAILGVEYKLNMGGVIPDKIALEA